MFQQYLPLLKNRTVQIVLGATLGILILLAILSPRKDSSVPPPPTLSSTPTSSNSSFFLFRSRAQLETLRSPFPFKKGQIPILVSSYPTSNNIITSLNIYYYPGDPNNTLRFEIYGLKYDNSEAEITAYRETFAHGLFLMRERGLNPSLYKFIYSRNQSIQSTASTWVLKYKLLP